ncbi:MAG TPA: quercetin 2,3-dioxygenase [Thermoleophilaceae bacterium]
MALSFTNPRAEIGDDQPVATVHSGGTPDGVAPGYALGPGEGPAIWFQGGIITMKARALDTDGGFAVTEWFGPRDMVAPGHVHDRDAEGFYILEGTLDIGVGDSVHQAVPGSYIYVPPKTVHDWRVTSAACKFLVFIVPGGFEHFFEALGEPAQSPTYPYTEHRQPPLEEIQAVGEKYGWSTGRGVLDTESTAPPTVGRLEHG